jgi:hypothetical protein
MKGVWKAIAYFIMYFGLTIIFQMLLSVGFMAIGAANLPEFILYSKPDISGGMFWGLILLFVCLFLAGMYVIQKTIQSDKNFLHNQNEN